MLVIKQIIQRNYSIKKEEMRKINNTYVTLLGIFQIFLIFNL